MKDVNLREDACMTTLAETLRRLSGTIDRLDARLLIEHVTGCAHKDFIAHPERPVSAADHAVLVALAARRAAGEPLAYLVGYADFRGLRLAVSPAVLVPRPETEELVALAIEKIAGISRPRVLDLGTGSGAIPLAIKAARPDAQVVAVDVSPAALAVARGNAERLGLAVDFFESDWYAKLPASLRVDLIVANPPYVAAGDPHLDGDGLRYEPTLALTDGADGLACLRTIVAGAPARLAAGGWLLCEHGYDQGAACRGLLAEAGFAQVQTWQDLSAIDRITGGQSRGAFCTPGVADA